MIPNIKKTIEEEIKTAYTSILSSEQIEQTIQWWLKEAAAIRKETIGECAEKIDLLITNWMRSYANLPLNDRKNGYNSATDIRFEVLKQLDEMKKR